jgi:hypothetical protein
MLTYQAFYALINLAAYVAEKTLKLVATPVSRLPLTGQRMKDKT